MAARVNKLMWGRLPDVELNIDGETMYLHSCILEELEIFKADLEYQRKQQGQDEQKRMKLTLSPPKSLPCA